MIESISTLSVQSSVLRYQPQSNTDSAPPVSAPREAEFVTSRIRVDNLQNIAILEYRSSEGAVVRQYPTQSQINAFKRAESLHTSESNGSANSAPQETTGNSQPSQGQTQSAAPAPAPAPATGGSAPASYSSAGTSAGGSGDGSTQSVVV